MRTLSGDHARFEADVARRRVQTQPVEAQAAAGQRQGQQQGERAAGAAAAHRAPSLPRWGASATAVPASARLRGLGITVCSAAVSHMCKGGPCGPGIRDAIDFDDCSLLFEYALQSKNLKNLLCCPRRVCLQRAQTADTIRRA